MRRGAERGPDRQTERGGPDGRHPLLRWGFDGLAPRLAILLTVALLPLGLIALDQTRGLSEEAGRRAVLSLLSRTRDAAAPVQQAVERALGAAEVLAGLAAAPAVPGLDAGEGCAALLSAVAGEGSPYAFVGIIPRAGPVTCASPGAPFGLGPRTSLLGSVPDPRPRVALAPGAAGDGRALVVTTPFGAGERLGEVVVAIRREVIPPVRPAPAGTRPLGVVVLNAQGEILDEGQGPQGLLPAEVALKELTGAGGRVIRARDEEGETRLYTVAPLLPGTLYAMGIWTPAQGAVGRSEGWGSFASAPILFPIGMWLASLLVAFWAANRLVVRPVGGLVERMRRFGADRSILDRALPPDAPRELREIDAAFRQTAHSILQDEARMENAFRERGVLLREVHHRVKNNLQLISSIISMQVRRAPDPRTRLILRRLQDRVLTLAAIYRSLYTSPDMGEASVAPVLRTIVEGEVAGHPGRVALSLELDDVVLDADKAVPLAFLVAEAVSNAVLQAAQAPGERRVSVTLTQAPEEARLVVTNTMPRSSPVGPPGALEVGSRDSSAGLGSKLIEAFTVQLGGRAESGPEDDTYRLAVTFPLDGEPSASDGTTADRAPVDARLSA